MTINTEALYPSMQQQPAVPGAADIPANIQTLRGSEPASPADKLYPSMAVYGAADELVNNRDPFLSAVDHKSMAQEITNMAKDVGLTSAEFGDIVRKLGDAERLTPEQVRANTREVAQRLRMEFGDKAGQVLEDARRLVARDPRMAKFITESKLGDIPDVIVTFARKAVQQKAAKRL